MYMHNAYVYLIVEIYNTTFTVENKEDLKETNIISLLYNVKLVVLYYTNFMWNRRGVSFLQIKYFTKFLCACTSAV